MDGSAGTDVLEIRRLAGAADPHLGADAGAPVPGRLRPSRFRRLPADDALSFDVGNNAVAASVTARGAIARASIFTGCGPVRSPLPGVWHDFSYLGFARDASVRLTTGGTTIALADPSLRQATTLAHGVFPTTRVRVGPLDITQAVLAPVEGGRRLRALLVCLLLETERTAPVDAAVVLPAAGPGREVRANLGPRGTGTVRRTAGTGRWIFLDGPGRPPRGGTRPVRVSAGHPAALYALLAMAESRAELAETLAACADGGTLLRGTAAFFPGRLPELRVGGRVTPCASVFRRSVCAQISTPLLERRGQCVGSSWGTDVAARYRLDGGWGPSGHVWMMDTFYNVLSAGLAAPELLLAGTAFFLPRSIPPADHATAHAPGPAASFSTANTLAPVVLAGVYHRLTGDGCALARLRAFETGRRPRRLEDAIVPILERVLDTRAAGGPWLFPSRMLSDGPARGTFHTGTNILAWFAFSSAARLMRGVFRDGAAAGRFDGIAARTARDIVRLCTVRRAGRTIFREGSGAEMIHDGEESATTIAPFLGFCEPDDARLTGFKRFACSPANPVWDAAAGGIRWNGTVTAPGFVTEAAGAVAPAEIRAALEKLVSLADADGQWWWWPMGCATRSRAPVRAEVGKSGWATGVFLLWFIRTVLGVSWDAPAERLSVAPAAPWRSFRCANLRMGSLALDLSYREDARATTVEIRHNRPSVARLDVTVRAPDGRRPAPGEIPGGAARSGTLFGSPARTVSLRGAGPAVRLVFRRP